MRTLDQIIDETTKILFVARTLKGNDSIGELLDSQAVLEVYLASLAELSAEAKAIRDTAYKKILDNPSEWEKLGKSLAAQYIRTSLVRENLAVELTESTHFDVKDIMDSRKARIYSLVKEEMMNHSRNDVRRSEIYPNEEN